MNRSDTSSLGRIQKLAQELQGARTARHRYEITKKINTLSKHAQADMVGATAHIKKRDPKRWDLRNVRAEYDRKEDIFRVYALPIEPVDHIYYANMGDALVIVSRDTHQPVGYQVDNFRLVWLKAHPEVQETADKVETPLSHLILKRFSRTWREFTKAVLAVLAAASNDHPKHPRPFY